MERLTRNPAATAIGGSAIGLLIGLLVGFVVFHHNSPVDRNAKYAAIQLKQGMPIADIVKELGEPDHLHEDVWLKDTNGVPYIYYGPVKQLNTASVTNILTPTLTNSNGDFPTAELLTCFGTPSGS